VSFGKYYCHNKGEMTMNNYNEIEEQFKKIRKQIKLVGDRIEKLQKDLDIKFDNLKDGLNNEKA
jgi:DNA anti-recombination protein RmuC